MKIEDAKYLKVCAHVRYWDDAEINGETCENGSAVPFKFGDVWKPIIDLDAGVVLNWPDGKSASFYFKVVDTGSYYLLDEKMSPIASIIENYVPDGLCHGDEGYGDYIIFKVGQDGEIFNYRKSICADDWADEN